MTTNQAGRIYSALHPTLGFLTQLYQRLRELGFTPTDEYYERVREALDAFDRLTLETHRLSRGRGAGRWPRC